MRKIILILSWFVAAPALCLFLLVFAYKLKLSPDFILIQPGSNGSPGATLGASAPILSQVLGVSSQVQTGDARPIIIAEFLAKHQSPLEPYEYYGEVLTDIADKYQLDFRLLPAIMMQESNLCKKIPENSYNCLGLGIHSQGTWGFASYEENFEAAAKVLRNNYLDQGLLTPDQIQNKYTPSSNGSWEFAVNHFMEILETAAF